MKRSVIKIIIDKKIRKVTVDKNSKIKAKPCKFQYKVCFFTYNRGSLMHLLSFFEQISFF